jgi:hypothetical protein
VRRYSPGVQEHPSWTQDGAGWTRCFFNHDPDLVTISRSFGGVEHPSGGFIFREAAVAEQAAQKLGIFMNIPTWAAQRQTKIKPHKDGRVVVEIERTAEDPEMADWLTEKKGPFKKIFNPSHSVIPESEIGNYDDIVRHLTTESGGDYGWVLKRESEWGEENLKNIQLALKASNINPKEVDLILGSSVMKPWKVVNRPFQPTFPGDRTWNRDSAQFRFPPSQGQDKYVYPHWQKILNHIGKSLNAGVESNAWCKANGILTGADYLKVWIASMIQYPLEPLPYLFLWGPQDSGKSILHEAIALLFTKGYVRADNALVSVAGFNAELRYAILCIIEETDLKRNKMAYAKIKDWVTSRQLPIHEKGQTPIAMPNSTHWIQCSNAMNACPIFPGDTRITMIHVPSLDPFEMIPKSKLIPLLEKEGPDFLGELLRLELPPPVSRLNVEVISTQEKITLEMANRTSLEEFVDERCHYVYGKMIKLSEFFDKFIEHLDPNELNKWSKQKVSSELDPKFPKGRNAKDGQWYYGNISWEPRNPDEPVLPKLVSENSMLRPENK